MGVIGNTDYRELYKIDKKIEIETIQTKISLIFVIVFD